MSKKSKDLSNTVVQALDLPKDLFLGLPNISLLGNREIYVSNHHGIMSYEEEIIILLIKDYQFYIKGKNLVISSYTRDEITIKGYIHSVEFI